MRMAAATRRASCRSSIVQQLPNDRSPLALSDTSYSCMDRPMTSCPCSTSSAAATDESTPPLIATRIFFLPLLMKTSFIRLQFNGSRTASNEVASKPSIGGGYNTAPSLAHTLEESSDELSSVSSVVGAGCFL